MGQQRQSGRQAVGLLIVLLLVLAGFVAAIGAPAAHAIYNGDAVTWKDHSQLVQIQKQTADGRTYTCGGSLLDDRWVLTAAHCASETDTGFYGCATFFSLEPRDCYVTAEHKLTLYMPWTKTTSGRMRVFLSGGEARDVAQVEVFPAYVQVYPTDEPKWEPYGCLWHCAKVGELAFVSGDLALLRLKTAASGRAHSRLASSDDLLTAARSVQALGWGDTDQGSGKSFPNDLQRTKAGTLQLMDPPTMPACQPGSSPLDQMPDGMALCAWSPASNGGTGSGDSGGPLYATDGDGAPTQVGVVSFGPTTGYPKKAEPDAFASIPRMIRWIRSKTGIGGSTSSPDNVATALVIDNSGSMSSNDPDLRRLDAAKAYVTTAPSGDMIGAVGFESFALPIAGMSRIPEERDTLLAALNSGVYAGGGTDIGAGLAFACELLDDSALPGKRAAILLTDGDGGYIDEASCYAARGWKVFTVGLGPFVNAPLLQSIADQTGGSYQPVPEAQNLQCEFQKIRAAIAGATPPPCLSQLIQLGQTLVKLVTVSARTAQIVFSSTWPGSDVEMTLISPSGRRIGRDSDDWDVAHTLTPTSETYVVTVPEAGEWSVELHGNDVAPEGEPVVFGSSGIPFDNELPELHPTAGASRGTAPLTVALHANASDPDGTVDSVVWDFGDGSAGAGGDVTHTYDAPGTYTPSATAVDDAGETATVALPSIVVTGQPPVARFGASVAGGRVTVDASASNDPDGSIVRYGWDFDSDGTLDVDGRAARASWDYATPGRRTITLGVASASGETAIATAVVEIAGGAAGGRGTAAPPTPRAAAGAAKLRIERVRVKGRRVLVKTRCLGPLPCRGRLVVAAAGHRRRIAIRLAAGHAHTYVARISRRRRWNGRLRVSAILAGATLPVDVRVGRVRRGRLAGVRRP